MFSVIQVNRIYLIFNLVHFLVDSSDYPRKKIIKPPQMYTKRKKHPDSVELYLPLESWGSDVTIAGLKRVFGENAVKLPHNEIKFPGQPTHPAQKYRTI